MVQTTRKYNCWASRTLEHALNHAKEYIDKIGEDRLLSILIGKETVMPTYMYSKDEPYVVYVVTITYFVDTSLESCFEP